ncbi:MAG: nodulation protein NfeD [Gammaproteobacteria bacterium]|nr:nodulation protein NfeD [Gammaproteobacteria bacterium]
MILLVLAWTSGAQAAGTAIQIDLEGALGVATAEFIIDGIETAQAQDANLIIIRMDTPGGLVEPMRDIVQAILGSDVPVVTYVSPGGARADSAGTYILLASHIAAMAPTTHLGAATPVSLTGEDVSPTENTPEEQIDDLDEDAEEAEPDAPDSAMGRKVLNDSIAYIRGLAEAHGRNADWAEEAVRDAATLTASDALELNVIDLIAADQAELLQAIHGREVKVNNEAFTIESEGLTVETLEPNWRLKILNTIASPEIAILLLMIGLYGLLFEGYNPGAIIPGVAGVICLLLAAYALQVLPVNYAGLALIIVGMILIIAEAFVPSFGALGLGGITAVIFGSIMMFDSGIPGFGISMTFVIGMALVAGFFLFWTVSYIVKLRRRGPVSGRESIVGGIATATESFSGDGHVWLESETWAARSLVPIKKDQKVRVRAMKGLVLEVEPIPESATPGAELQT